MLSRLFLLSQFLFLLQVFSCQRLLQEANSSSVVLNLVTRDSQTLLFVVRHFNHSLCARNAELVLAYLSVCGCFCVGVHGLHDFPDVLNPHKHICDDTGDDDEKEIQ